MEPSKVLDFWFNELNAEQWFKKNAEVDAEIKKRFLVVLEQAKKAELYSWRIDARGRLAEIIVLDQFSRNIYRDDPRAFEADALALILSQEMVLLKQDQDLPAVQKAFCYMPYMHSESRAIHELAVKLFNLPGLEHNLKFELEHKKIIDDFGRYPHRNKVLNRESTAEEREFLKSHNGF